MRHVFARVSVPSLAAAGLCLYGLATWSSWRAALVPHLGLGFLAVLGALALGAAANVALALRNPQRVGPAVGAAAWIACLGASVVAYLAVLSEHQTAYAAATLGLAGVAHAGLTAVRLLTGDRRIGRVLDRAAVAGASAVLGLALVEGALRVAARLSPSPLTADPSQGLPMLRAYRLEPGTPWVGFPVNSRGDNDDEPPAPGTAERLVVVIGDSFSFTPVPRPLHYTSVCERELAGVNVYNMGAAGIGPPEYLALLVDEALPLAPDLVVVAIFTGNDLFPDPPGTAGPHPLFDRRGNRLWSTAGRLLNLRAASRRARDEGADLAVLSGAYAGASAEDADKVPWLTDPLREIAPYSVEQFDEIELVKARAQVDIGPRSLATFTAWIDALVAAAGEVPITFLLIPDEFQIEDALWARVHAAVPDAARDGAQRELVPWFAERGYPLLDLLPVMRGVPPMDDGKRHLYHLRETHFNRRGNEVVGRALAEFVAECAGW